MYEHASFFSGAGGVDLGLERAGWTTVSHSEIEPYANAVLASRWPGVPNLGSIVDLAEGVRVAAGQPRRTSHRGLAAVGREPDDGRDAWQSAYLWSGGFPCQDLSVAGRRRGLAGARSGLAFAFLDLVERHRPPAVLLENVPGLLSSHGGRDLGALTGRLGELGYWWAYRVLDARHFGVPQRRRRVFILALHAGTGAGPDSAGAVLAVGSRCGGHPASGGEAGAGVAGGATGRAHGSLADGADATRTLGANMGHHGYALGTQDLDGGYLQVSPALTTSQERLEDPYRQAYIVATQDGLARAVVGANRYDDDTNTMLIIPDIAATLNSGGNSGGFRTEPGEHLVTTEYASALTASAGHHGYSSPRGDGTDTLVMAPAFSKRPGQQIATRDDGLSYSLTSGEPPRVLSRETDVAYSLRADPGGTGQGHNVDYIAQQGVRRLTPVECERLMGWPEGHTIPDEWKGKRYDRSDLLPVGLDSHRYRLCGNGVVAPVAEWIGRRLRAWFAGELEDVA